MAHRLLSEWGFRVFEAESGEEGMEVLETARSGIQLVIVDVVMPLADLVLGTLLLRSKVKFKQAEGPAVPNVQPREKGVRFKLPVGLTQ